MPVATCDICSSTTRVIDVSSEYRSALVSVLCASCREEVEGLLMKVATAIYEFDSGVRKRTFAQWVRSRLGLDNRTS